MATNPGSYGTSQATTAPTTGTVPPAPVTQGSFPQTPSGQGLGTNGLQVANISVADFLANYDISSTEESTYVSQGTNGQPQLNQNALFLMQYRAMDPIERENYQQALVNAGLMPASDANGINNPTALSAFKSAIANAAATGTQVDQYLQQYTGTNNAELALTKATSVAQEEAQAPTTVTQENPTTLAATITNAFDQALGYAPNQDQINSFISQMQGQDVSNAQAPHQAAEQQLSFLKSEQSQIEKMGPDGLDAIITAYTNAIHGVNPTAGNPNAPQGPATGTAPAPNAPNANPAGQLFGPSQGGTTTQVPNSPFYIGSSLLSFGRTHTATTPPPTPGMVNQPQAPVGSPGTVPTYGGIYALTPADWSEAKKLLPNLKLPNSAGQASTGVQETVLRTLLQNLYDNNGGSWTDAIVSIAGGNPKNTAGETVTGSKASLQTFATNIANEVNNQLTSLTNTINNQDVTVKTTQPDATAEAAAAAKQADPVGYYSANYASAGSLLNQMLAGAPQMYDQSTADSFSGPVPAGEAAASATPTQAAA